MLSGGGGDGTTTAAAADVVMEMAVVRIRVHMYKHSIRLSSNWCTLRLIIYSHPASTHFSQY